MPREPPAIVVRIFGNPCESMAETSRTGATHRAYSEDDDESEECPLPANPRCSSEIREPSGRGRSEMRRTGNGSATEGAKEGASLQDGDDVGRYFVGQRRVRGPIRI